MILKIQKYYTNRGWQMDYTRLQIQTILYLSTTILPLLAMGGRRSKILMGGCQA